MARLALPSGQWPEVQVLQAPPHSPRPAPPSIALCQHFEIQGLQATAHLLRLAAPSFLLHETQNFEVATHLPRHLPCPDFSNLMFIFSGSQPICKGLPGPAASCLRFSVSKRQPIGLDLPRPDTSSLIFRIPRCQPVTWNRCAQNRPIACRLQFRFSM